MAAASVLEPDLNRRLGENRSYLCISHSAAAPCPYGNETTKTRYELLLARLWKVSLSFAVPPG